MTKRLGEYCVGDLRFINKYDAMLFAKNTGLELTWDFNDAVFSCYDWAIPITKNINELYKERAQQLRDKYDYVSLFFSGGADSTNILHAFIDNNIILDEIVMFKPKYCVYVSGINTLGYNLYSEIELAAIPHLKKYVEKRKIKVRTIYFEDVFDKFFSSTYYINQFFKLNILTPTSLARVAMAVTDLDWDKLYDAGKTVAHIQGVEKPVVECNNKVCTFKFNDYSGTFVFQSNENTDLSEKLFKYQHHEFFYWTPDLPELVIKQAQIAKEFHFKNINKNFNMDEFLKYLYPLHALEARNSFNAGKAIAGVNAINHRWIHSPQMNNAKNVFIDILQSARNTLGEHFGTIDPNIKTSKVIGAYKTINSKKYIL
jgi:hypothetical protein